MNCFFATDLHGSYDRYLQLFELIIRERPSAVFLGGDLLPRGFGTASAVDSAHQDFINGFLARRLNKVRRLTTGSFPRIFIILGNDDTRFEEAAVLDVATTGLWDYVHNKRVRFGKYNVYGYSHIPPTPFLLKDWEKYDISRHVDPGTISPEEGHRSVPVPENRIKWGTIADDLKLLKGKDSLQNAIFLFHTPPYKTNLDRADLDGKMVDHVPLDLNIGSIAVRKFIEQHQPLLTLHGHVHESSRITGSWRDVIGRTHCFSAAHDGPELALVRFDPDKPGEATRELV